MNRVNMSTRALEITVISAEGLRIGKKQAMKKNSFVTIRTDNTNVKTTRMDKEGGSNPAWDEKLVIDMPLNIRSHLTVEVQCKTSMGNKIIGTARIAASEFCGGHLPENYLHFLSYRLRDDKGEKNGIINLSMRMKSPATGAGGCAVSCSRPWKEGPAVGETSSGVVTGVPVWSKYQI